MRKGSIRVTFLTMLVALLAVSVNGVLAEQEGHEGKVPHKTSKVISLAGGTVSPETLEITRGDTVIWFAVDQPAMVYFSEGTPVKLACVAPTRFRLNEEEAYTSGLIPPGGTASLCFVEPGTFNYAVFFRGGVEAGGRVSPGPGVPAGRIIVK
ncbi:MAG: hypothetical protein HY347_05435 [candidate division NC10 bacterium]|nr:hypothetical protein [candidate division NC10 bacterium]